MITAIIIMCLREFYKIHFNLNPKIVLIILPLLFLFPQFVQGQLYKYNIVRNEQTIGWIHIEKSIQGDTEKIKLQSEINIKFLFNISASINEEVSFINGNLISSVLNRKINGKVKTDKKFIYTSEGYEITENGKIKQLVSPLINFNIHCLYFKEPKDQTLAFADYLNQFVNIENTGNGTYTINFPHGVNQQYFYKSGVLVKVKMSDRFYNADIILSSN